MAGLDAPDPAAILGMWAAGVAGAGAVVSRWRIVGGGFIRLASAVGLLLGGGAWLAGGGAAAGIGLAALAVSLVAARHPAAAAVGSAPPPPFICWLRRGPRAGCSPSPGR